MKTHYSLFGVLALSLMMNLAWTSFAVSENSKPCYIVSLKEGQQMSEEDFRTAIEGAGGTVKSILKEIDVALVESDRPGFRRAVKRAIPGNVLDDVVPNVAIKYPEIDFMPGRVSAVGSESDLTISGGAAENYDKAAGTMTGVSRTGFDPSQEPLLPLQWGHKAIRAPEAWAKGNLGAGVRVAVLDNGFDLNHEDLVQNINFDLSKNFVPDEELQFNTSLSGNAFSHGTHVAGTVAAAANGYGGVGVAPEAELVLVKVIGDVGIGNPFDILAGIIHATDIGADVMNLSFGTYMNSTDPDLRSLLNELRNMFKRAIKYATTRQVTIITAAGNDNINFSDAEQEGLVHFQCNFPRVICISATGPYGWAYHPNATNVNRFASYSNYGMMTDFAAPGGGIDLFFEAGSSEVCRVEDQTTTCFSFDLVLSSSYGNQYMWAAGTSMSAPHAAGIAALIIHEMGGNVSPTVVRNEMKRRALRFQNGEPLFRKPLRHRRDMQYGFGLVQAV